MGTTVVYSDAADATMLKVGDGSGDADSVDASATTSNLGMYGSYNWRWENFHWFATAYIDDANSVTDAVFALYGVQDTSVQDFNIQVAEYNWGDTASASDWLTVSELAALTPRATFATSGGFSTSYNTFSDANGGLKAIVDKTGNTRVIVYSDRHAAGYTASSNENVEYYQTDQTGTANDPKLTVTDVTVAPTPAAIVTSVTVHAVTVSLGKTVTQTAIVATAALPAPTVLADSTVTPAVIATSTAVPQVTVTAGADRTPDTITATVTAPQAAVTAAANVPVAVIATTVTAPQSSVTLSGSVTPDAIAATVAAPQATVQAAANVTPAVISTVVALPAAAATASVDATATPAVVACTAAIPQASPQASSTVTPAVVATVATLPSGATTLDWTVTPAYIAAVLAAGTPTAGNVNEFGHSTPTVTSLTNSTPTVR